MLYQGEKLRDFAILREKLMSMVQNHNVGPYPWNSHS